LFQFGQAAFLDFAEFLQGAAQEEITDAVEGETLGLEEADGDQLEEVFLAIAGAAAGEGRIDESERPVIADVPFGHAFTGLAAGGGDLVLVAPFIGGLGELIDGVGDIHDGGNMTVNSVSVK